MSFRSLFAKIFLWFWLSITIVIGSLVLVTWLYPYRAVQTLYLPARLHDLQARGAVAVYELKGQEAFDKHRKELDSASRLRTYYLDEQEKELSGETVPDRLLEFAKEHQAEIDRGERVSVGQPSQLAIPIVGASGRRFLALAEPNRSGLGSGPDFVPGARSETRSDGPREPPREPPREGRADSGGAGGPPRDIDRDGERDSKRGPGGRGPGPGPPRQPGPQFELLVPAHVLILRLLAVILAAGLGCYALARHLTSPVRRLQQAVRQLASGDLTARVGKRLVTRHDEIGELGRDFDRMAGQVETLVTSQNRLLRDVSHELRSPLSRLNVALELAGRDAGEAAAPALARVAREAERLNELIGQLLTLARLEGGVANHLQTPVDLNSLVREIAADADFEASARSVRVRITHADPCTVIGTVDLLRSAIENVVRNAVKYTADATHVDVSLRAQQDQDEKRAIIEVRDHGPGLPEESLSQIFQPFYRISDARDRRTGGTGLGLAITDRALRLHGGEVHAANATGGGLTIRISLSITEGIGTADERR